MPTYPYECKKCEESFDVIKSVSAIDDSELCVKCGDSNVERVIAHNAIDRSCVFEPYFEPALGEIIRSKEQKRRVLKAKGCEEIGNESPEKMYQSFERERERRMKREWEAI